MHKILTRFRGSVIGRQTDCTFVCFYLTIKCQDRLEYKINKSGNLNIYNGNQTCIYILFTHTSLTQFWTYVHISWFNVRNGPLFARRRKSYGKLRVSNHNHQLQTGNWTLDSGRKLPRLVTCMLRFPKMTSEYLSLLIALFFIFTPLQVNLSFPRQYTMVYVLLHKLTIRPPSFH